MKNSVIEKLLIEQRGGVKCKLVEIMWMSKPVDESRKKSSRFLECKLSVCFRVRAEVSGTGKSSEKLRRLINDSHQRIYNVKVSVAWICKQQPESFRHYIHDEWLQMRSKIDNFGFLHLAPRALLSDFFMTLIRVHCDIFSFVFLHFFSLLHHFSGLYSGLVVVWIHKSISLQCALFIRYLFRFLCDSCSHASHAPHWNIIKFITLQLESFACFFSLWSGLVSIVTEAEYAANWSYPVIDLR